MQLALAIGIFIIGIVFIVKGGDWFVDSATWMARAAKIPTFIVGATIVSFATTLPELIVSLIASVENKNDMAIGNAVGSVIANTGLIMAIAFTFISISTPRKNYWPQCLLLLGSATVLWLGCLSGAMSLWASIILLLICVMFMVLNIVQGRRAVATTTTDVTTAAPSETIIINKKTIAKNIVLFLVGAAGVIVGSNFLINGGSTMAEFLHIPERLVAITLVAVGTSLPELVTTVTAIRKKEGGLSVGNIIGANIIDLTLILPICSFVAHDSFTVSAQYLMIDFPFCLAFSLLALVPLLGKQRSYRWQGILMLLGYLAYVIVSAVL